MSFVPASQLAQFYVEEIVFAGEVKGRCGKVIGRVQVGVPAPIVTTGEARIDGNAFTTGKVYAIHSPGVGDPMGLYEQDAIRQGF